MKTLVLLLSLLPALVDAQPLRYREGQVWSYHTRLGDAGSLLKIQHIEGQGDRLIYHISVIGFHLRKVGMVPMLPHEPVSQQTLDNSVVSERPDPGTFPSADEGIAEWRRAHGGVYTITVAETLELLDRTLSQQGEAPDMTTPI